MNCLFLFLPIYNMYCFYIMQDTMLKKLKYPILLNDFYFSHMAIHVP